MKSATSYTACNDGELDKMTFCGTAWLIKLYPILLGLWHRPGCCPHPDVSNILFFWLSDENLLQNNRPKTTAKLIDDQASPNRSSEQCAHNEDHSRGRGMDFERQCGCEPFFASSLQSLCWELNESLEQTFKSAVPLIRYDFKGCSSGCPLKHQPESRSTCSP